MKGKSFVLLGAGAFEGRGGTITVTVSDDFVPSTEVTDDGRTVFHRQLADLPMQIVELLGEVDGA